MALLNWQIVNETALQCVADKPSTIAREASEVVGCYGWQVLNRGLLQARLWEFRPDEERPHAFIYYKLSSPFPDRNQEVSIVAYYFFLIILLFSLILSRSLLLPLMKVLIACSSTHYTNPLRIFAGIAERLWSTITQARSEKL